jgi:hypothetical protein
MFGGRIFQQKVGMKQTYLHLWYPYFKLNGIDAINEITKPRII